MRNSWSTDYDAAMLVPGALLKVDFQLLACLDALIAERYVTRAAEKMGMSQPAMSAALARLREALGDPLLVRTARGMIPTPRGTELAGVVRFHLRGLAAELVESAPFDSATARAKISIATTDFTGVLLLPRLMSRLRQEAPGINLLVRLPDPNHIRDWLEEGECDIAVGLFPEVAEDLRVSTLFDDPLVCVVSRDYSSIGDTLSLAQYMDASHTVFGSPFAPVSTIDQAVDATLASLGLVRKVSIQLASILLPPHVVAQTDLIATTPARLATYFSAILPVRLFPPPFEIPDLRFSLVWHERTHRMGPHQYVRQLIREVALASDHIIGPMSTSQRSAV